VRAAWWFAIGYFAAWLALGLARRRLYRRAKRLTRREVCLADRGRGRTALGYVVLANVLAVATWAGYIVATIVLYGNWEAAVHILALGIGVQCLLMALLGYWVGLQVVGSGWGGARYVVVPCCSLTSGLQVAYCAVLTILPAVYVALALRG
jgi:hypothetical protein